MKKTSFVMGMPSTIEVVDTKAFEKDLDEIFNYFRKIDRRFSTYKTDSEVEKINQGQLKSKDYSREMKKILKFSEQTKLQTNGYFDVYLNGRLDPSGIVKGYAIFEASKILKKKGFKNFYVEIAGDIEVSGKNSKGEKWRVGIQNPFNPSEVIKVLNLTDCGVATSGNYQRGAHIYNPKNGQLSSQIASITVIGPNVYEADRFATACFAMGNKGINFLQNLKNFEGFMVNADKKSIATSGFENLYEVS